MKWIAVICLALLASCSGGTHESGECCEVGQYVYKDGYECVHIRLDCPVITEGSALEDERNCYRQGVKFVDTCDLEGIGMHRFCPRCIDDEAYKKLSQIIERNSTMPGVEPTSSW